MAPGRRKGMGKSSKAAKHQWKPGDLVLAKVKGFPAWPATVSEPEKWGYSADWRKVLVYFFGTNQIAFCNPVDVEAFTEDKKNALLIKSQGKGADFVRAVNEIIDIYEKLNLQGNGEEFKSDDEGTVVSNGQCSKRSRAKSCKKSQKRKPHGRNESMLETSDNSLDDRSGSHNPVDTSDTDMDIPLASTTLRKKSRNSSLPSSDTQCKAPSVRRQRSASRADNSELQKFVVTANGNSNDNVISMAEEPKRKKRLSKSTPDDSEVHVRDLHIDGPIFKDNQKINKEEAGHPDRNSNDFQSDLSSSCSPAFVAEDSSGDIRGETVVEESAGTSLNTRGVTISNGKLEDHDIIDEPYKNGMLPLLTSDQPSRAIMAEYPTKMIVLRKKRNPNRKRTLPDAMPCARMEKDANLDISTKPPETCGQANGRFHTIDGDEHLPLVKRARARLGKPSIEDWDHDANTELKSEGNILNKPAGASHTSPCSEHKNTNKEVECIATSVKMSAISMNDRSCMPWKVNKFHLRDSSVDGEAGLPPSKRLHRALEAMCANAAEADDVAESDSINMENQEIGEIKVDVSFKVRDDPSQEGDVLVNDAAGLSSESPSLPRLRTETCSEEKPSIHIIGSSLDSIPGDFNEMVKEGEKHSDVKVIDGLPQDIRTSDSEIPVSSLELCSPPQKGCNSVGFGHDVCVLHPSPQMEKHATDHAQMEQRNEEPSLSPGRVKMAKEKIIASPVEVKSVKEGIIPFAEVPIVKEEIFASHVKVKIPKEKSCASPAEVELPIAESSKDNSDNVLDGEASDSRMGRSDDEQQTKLLYSPKLDGEFSPTNGKRVPHSAIGGTILSSSVSANVLSQSLSEENRAIEEKRAIEEYKVLKDPPITLKDFDFPVSSRPMKVLIAAAQAKRNLSRSAFLSHSFPTADDKVMSDSGSSPSPVLGKLRGNAEVNMALKSFEDMLGSLTRTKESIGRATRLAIDCAKFGIAGEVVDILLQHLETEPSLHRRVDLFFLVDSITQCSRGQRGVAGDAYPPAVQALLPRLLSAAAPPGNAARENRRQCLKVLRLWLERKTLPESIVRRHMQELDLSSGDPLNFSLSRRPSRTERAFNDPAREMEGMLVDEYGSNTSFQLVGLHIPQLIEDEEDASATEEKGTAPATPVEAPEPPVSGTEKHRRILEDVDGELEMEDVSPSAEIENNSTYQDQFGSTPCVRPHPEGLPPSAPPLPSSPPPLAPPPPPSPPPLLPQLRPRLFECIDSQHNPPTNSFQGNLPLDVTSQPPRVPAPYMPPRCPDSQVQMPATVGPYSSSSSYGCPPRAAYPVMQPGNNVQHSHVAPLPNNVYQVQPPRPAISSQFSFVQQSEPPKRLQPWSEGAPSPAFTPKGPIVHDSNRWNYSGDGNTIGRDPHHIDETCRSSSSVYSGYSNSEKPGPAYAPVHYGPSDHSSITNHQHSQYHGEWDYRHPAPTYPPISGGAISAHNSWRPV
ncbi:protein HUA2-LIKE 2 isoform X2 [Amborella trichopoda]|uniref:protein HUA2-LIKE 2 isoform X2 n=1 Tax=Amborella trichopoda TaxID=13333 RepID=UPI0005D42B99|nr:protein HUA2-LIKE 2 isoform X2 [Amborella trichopoda]|eukprot:XP_011625693.1 protein HUA2-LIKE 2 isoform X2 [Amborella trichopoda]